MGPIRNAYRILVGKLEGKRPFGRYSENGNQAVYPEAPSSSLLT
jgi:hypothetical protein